MGILLVWPSVHAQESLVVGLAGLVALGFFSWRALSAIQPFIPLRTVA